MSYKRTALFLLLPLVAVGAAQADQLPSPCDVGEMNAGTNCMYLVSSGSQYNPATGDRSAPDTGLEVAIEVWVNFAEVTVLGGGFDVTYDITQVEPVNWIWSPEFSDLAFSPGSPGATGWEAIYFGDFSGVGAGGPDPLHVGTLTVTLLEPGTVFFAIEQPYFTDTFPDCFIPTQGPTECVPTNFFALNVSTDDIPDALDNCINVANADQRDVDEDGFGSICDGDFNNDCQIDFADLNIMAATFFTNDPATDMDGNGAVDFTDLDLLARQFFLLPGPSGIASCEVD